MKKRRVLAVLLAFILVISTFSGCSGKRKTLEICVDMAFSTDVSHLETAMYELEFALKEYDGLTDLQFRYIPVEGAERSTALDRIRTEVMSGGGPDVFIMATSQDRGLATADTLFKMPEKSMEIGLFLPLDELMENNTQYAQWDEMTQTVLDAGRNAEGQMLIPMTYTMPVLMYRAENFQHTPSAEMTWQDMRADETLADAAAHIGDGLQYYDTHNGEALFVIDFNMDFLLGKLADYEAEKLCFTEQELLTYAEEVLALQDYTEEKGVYGTEGWNEADFGIGMNCCAWRPYNEQNGINDSVTFSLVPLYSREGGTTAIVMNYLAINRNTRHPEDAFKVIDRLMSKDMQQKGNMYLEAIYVTHGCMPMYEDLMQETMPLHANSYAHKYTYYSDENFRTVSAVRDCITNVQFRNELTVVLENMMLQCYDAKTNGEEYSEIVHEAYTTMKQMIGE